MSADPKSFDTSSSKLPPLESESSEIRLMGLPDPTASQEYSISVHSLNENPEYCALSYVWGTEEGSETRQLNDAAFSVRPNLAAALEQLVQKANPRLIWIDAVCIDQENLHERNSQVRMMARIYQQAWRVYVWLGPGDEASAFLMQPDLVDRLPRDPAEVSGADAARLKQALFQFSQRNWWDRIWVVQEAVFARAIVVLCGSDMLPWPSMRSNLEAGKAVMESSWTTFVDPYAQSAMGGLASVIKVVAFMQQILDFAPPPLGQHQWPLLNNLRKLRQRMSSDPRDKVFAILGLESAEDLDGLEVDYSLSLASLYTRVASHVVQRTKTLHFLAACERQRSPDGMASWVPNWSDSSRPVHTHNGLHYTDFGVRPMFSAGGRGPLDFTVDLATVTLKLKGTFYDTISGGFGISAVDNKIGLLVMWICGLLFTIRRKRAYIGTNFTVSFLTVLTAGLQVQNGLLRRMTIEEVERPAAWIESTAVAIEIRAEVSRINGSWAEFDKYVDAVVKKYVQGLKEGPEGPIKEADLFAGADATLEESLIHWFNPFFFVRPDRTLFLTDTGKLALGPRAGTPGDVIFIPVGAEVPLMVRKRENGGYRFLGECYCQNIMNGEAMDIGKTEYESIGLQ